MTAQSMPANAACVRAALASHDDFDAWRAQARQLIMAAVPPDRVVWEGPGEGNADLFTQADAALPPPLAGAPQPRSSRAFLELAQAAALHSDPARFALLYRLLWRLQRNPLIMEDGADGDVRHVHEWARTVRRDIHKMHAFIRFRMVRSADGRVQYVAWFEPEHHILRAGAAFFVSRFTNMNWSILTPQGSIHWDGAVLRQGPPAQSSDALADDETEDLWHKYYASIFNPARLKVGAMMKEMPRKYWKNMPETALIPALIAGAQAREAAMVTCGASRYEAAQPVSLAAVADGIAGCRRCSIGCQGTRAVPGEGPMDAPVMIVGEQPGNDEEQQGRPFTGPAGQLLRWHLAQAGLVADHCYSTNAVKHFKFAQQASVSGGQMRETRLHQTPTAAEIDMCRWWLEAERALVKPQLVLALGASAARSLLGRTANIQRERGRPLALSGGGTLWLTVHPSYLLRLEGAARIQQEALFAEDLRRVSAQLSNSGEPPQAARRDHAARHIPNIRSSTV